MHPITFNVQSLDSNSVKITSDSVREEILKRQNAQKELLKPNDLISFSTPSNRAPASAQDVEEELKQRHLAATQANPATLTSQDVGNEISHRSLPNKKVHAFNNPNALTSRDVKDEISHRSLVNAVNNRNVLASRDVQNEILRRLLGNFEATVPGRSRELAPQVTPENIQANNFKNAETSINNKVAFPLATPPQTLAGINISKSVTTDIPNQNAPASIMPTTTR